VTEFGKVFGRFEKRWGGFRPFFEIGEGDADLGWLREIAAGPETLDDGGEGNGILGGGDAGFGMPGSDFAGDVDVHVAGPEFIGAEPSTGFVGEPEEDGSAIFVVAEIGGEDV